jgi:hypothetical protein
MIRRKKQVDPIFNNNPTARRRSKSMKSTIKLIGLLAKRLSSLYEDLVNEKRCRFSRSAFVGRNERLEA